MKIVTKRHGKVDSLKDAVILLRTIQRLRNRGIARRGIYRFSSFREADEWMMRQIANIPAPPKSKI